MCAKAEIAQEAAREYGRDLAVMACDPIGYPRQGVEKAEQGDADRLLRLRSKRATVLSDLDALNVVHELLGCW